jgi:hypothetical protein
MIELKNDFSIVENGTRYQVPDYEVIDGQGIQKTGAMQTIRFVRGSRLAEEDVVRREGTLPEHLLAVMIHDLKYKNSLVPSNDTHMVITKLEEAFLWLIKRQIDRAARDVVGTYKK